VTVETVLQELVSYLRSKFSDFEPNLKAITLEEFWSVATTREDLAAQLPCIVVSLNETTTNRELLDIVQQDYLVTINLLQQVANAGSRPGPLFRNLDALLAQLTEDVIGPEFSGPLVSVESGSSKPNNGLAEWNILWLQCPLTLKFAAIA
jgi:glutathione peroxidase-family protein